MGLLLSLPPEQEPIGLNQAKAHLHVEGDEDDAMILALIAASRAFSEEFMGRSLITQTWLQKFDEWPVGEIELHKPPVRSVSSVKYYDSSGTLQTIDPANYEVSFSMWKARLRPAGSNTWPIINGQLDAVEIEYVAGYGDTGHAVPAPIIQSMLVLIGQMYDGACSSDDMAKAAAAALLSPYKVPVV